MSVCHNVAPPSGIPAVILPTVPGRARPLPVMSVNGARPGADGDVKLSALEVVAPSVDPSAEGKAADALATGQALDDMYRKGEVDQMVAEAFPVDYDGVKDQVRQNADAVAELKGLVPPQASASNQLADKAFVNSSIATSTATFRGTYNLVTDLGLPLDATHVQVAAAVKARLGQADYDGSDYVFVQIPQDTGHTDAMKRVDRYKCVETGTDPVVKSWEYEWTLNNSSFTAAQWAAINSGITSGLVAKLDGIEAGAQVNVIETVKVNGTALTPQDKAVDIPVPALDDAVTRTSANGVKSSGIWSAIWGALAALPTGFTSLYDWCVSQLAGKASTADATLTPVYGDTWVVSPSVGPHGYPLVISYGVHYGPTIWSLNEEVYISDVWVAIGNPSADATSLTFDMNGTTVVATRQTTEHVEVGYTLGSQTNKPLASGAEAEALRNDKLDKSAVVSPSPSATAGQAADAKATGDALEPLLFAQYYPDGSVKSAAEFTQGIKYDAPDTTNRTITVKPFCNTGDSDNDNSPLSGRVVIPPFVDAQGNPYISDDGTRFKVVGVSGGSSQGPNTKLTSIIASSTVTTIGDDDAFYNCTSLTSVSLPAATSIGRIAFYNCTALTTISLPAATSIGRSAFTSCTSLTSVSLPAATSIGKSAFYDCTALTTISLPAVTDIGDNAFTSCTLLTSVDFGDTPRAEVPTLGSSAFSGVPSTCKIIVPYAQYDVWIAADGWRDLPQEFVRHAEKADKPATFTTGNLAALDANGNPTDSGKKPSDFQSALAPQQLANIAAVPDKLDKSGGIVTGPVLFNSANPVLGPLTLGFNADPEHVENTLDIVRASNGDIYLHIRDTTLADMVQQKLPRTSGIFALLSDIYAAVQQIAPAWVSGTAYAVNALATYDGAVYRCKANTVSPHTTTPNADTTHWEAKPVSELFLPILGGEKIDDLVIKEGEIRLYGNSSSYWAICKDARGIYLYNGTDAYYLVPNDGTRSGGGTYALTAGSGHTGNLAALDASGNPTDSGKKPSDFQSVLSQTQLANIAAVPNKADISALRFDCDHVATVSTGTTPSVTNLADRASNRATLGSTVTAATITLPVATTGKMRDFYVRLIIQSSTAPTITFYDPATSVVITSANIPFGSSSLADIAPGDNLVLFTEIEPYKWLVSVKHEEAAS